MRARRLVVAAALASVAGLVVSGCSINGTQSLPTPLSKGGGSGAYDVTVLLASAGGLVPHAEVKVNDVSVGEVQSISFDAGQGWHAKVVVSLQKGTKLPSNATASIAQKSLLGAEYLGISTPTTGASPTLLTAGDVIPLSRTGSYPETEQVLAALSVVLNGSGLSQLQTINTELNAALNGRQGDARALLSDLDTFVGGLDAQKADIVAAIDNLNSFSAQLAANNATVAQAIDRLGPGLKALQANVPQLGTTLVSLRGLSDTATRVVNASSADLTTDLKLLQPALASLASTGQNLPKLFEELSTYPFPLTNAARNFRGDYTNLYAVVDLRCATLATTLLSGVAGVSDVVGAACKAQSTVAQNPLTAPYAAPSTPTPSPSATPSGPLSGVGGTVGGLLGGVGGLLGGSGQSPSPSPSASSGSSSGGGLLGGLLGGGGR